MFSHATRKDTVFALKASQVDKGRKKVAVSLYTVAAVWDVSIDAAGVTGFTKQDNKEEEKEVKGFSPRC